MLVQGHELVGQRAQAAIHPQKKNNISTIVQTWIRITEVTHDKCQENKEKLATSK
uniref:Uncharacterized protein n=1 Tax=Arundo donax TaxID=35708 RepID=A0A0A9FF20_ARUDO